MKLAASIFCVAALTLTGCVDETVNPGGHTAGMRPAKPSPDHPDSPYPLISETLGFAQQIDIRFEDADNYLTNVSTLQTEQGGGNVCDDCGTNVIAFVLTDNRVAEEIRVVSDGGGVVCRLYLSDNGVVDECGYLGK